MSTQSFCLVNFRKLTPEILIEIDPSCEVVFKNNSGIYVFALNHDTYLREKNLTHTWTAWVDIGDGKFFKVFRDLDGKIVYSSSPIVLMNYIGQQGWRLFEINYDSDNRRLIDATLVFYKETDL